MVTESIINGLCKLFLQIFFLSLTASGEIPRPSFTVQPEDTSVIVGNDVMLPCTVQNLDMLKNVQWTKDAFGLGFERALNGFPRYSMTGNEAAGEYNLFIKNTTIDDEDEFECQITYFRLRTKTAKLTVLVPPQKPIIDDVTNGKIDVFGNKENLITCRSFNGKPAPNLKWYRDGKVITENVTYAVTDGSSLLQNVSATLRIWATHANDGEKYVCVMSTTVTKTRKNFPTNFTKSVVLNVLSVPVVNIAFQPSQSINEGSSLLISCETKQTKPPVSIYEWYIDKEKQTEASSTLKLSNVGKHMNGATVGCRAINRVGPSPITSQRLNILYPPILKTGPKKVITNSSKQIKFYCEWDSNPMSQIKWYRSETQGKKDAVLGVGNTLTMNSVQQSDAGQISCVADAPGVGRNEAKTDLVVWGKPIISSDDEQFVKLGKESAVVECRISSDPGIQHVVWKWESDGERYSLSDNNSMNILMQKPSAKNSFVQANKVKYESRFHVGDRVARLFIYDAKKVDLIAYNCTAANQYGTAEKMFLLREEIRESSMGVIAPVIGGTLGGIFLVVFAIIICTRCPLHCRRNKQKFTKNEKSDDIIKSPSKISSAPIESDSENPSTTSSLLSPGHQEEILVVDLKPPGQNDDGYYTEGEVNPSTKTKITPPLYNSRSAGYLQEQDVPLLQTQISHSSVRSSQSPGSETSSVRSHGYHQSKENAGFEPHFNPGSDLPPVREHRPVNKYPTNSYSSLGRNGIYSPQPSCSHRGRTGSTTPSIVRSLVSVPTSPYARSRGRTPSSSVHERYTASYQPNTAPGQDSSHSSLEHSVTAATYSVYDPLENGSHVSSRLSHASRSSDMFHRPFTARMATHV